MKRKALIILVGSLFVLTIVVLIVIIFPVQKKSSKQLELDLQNYIPPIETNTENKESSSTINANNASSTPKMKTGDTNIPQKVKLGGVTLKVDVADTEKERNQGLSGRKSMPFDTGMLFIFDYEDFWGIWMKDMKFSIDIIWIDKDLKIIDIKQDVSPDTFPLAFRPKSLSSYVIEVNANFVSKNKIKIGDKLEINSALN
ncbi:MAG: DUF192 domain-containing protein [Candidatus Paceibacterota bacterium]